MWLSWVLKEAVSTHTLNLPIVSKDLSLIYLMYIQSYSMIQPVYPKGDQSWVFIGRTDVEAETPILCHLMRRADSLENTLMLGKIEGRRRKG